MGWLNAVIEQTEAVAMGLVERRQDLDGIVRVFSRAPRAFVDSANYRPSRNQKTPSALRVYDHCRRALSAIDRLCKA